MSRMETTMLTPVARERMVVTQIEAWGITDPQVLGRHARGPAGGRRA